MNKLKSIAELQDFLKLAIEKTSFQAEPIELYEPISYFLSLGGKRLRPALVLMSADLYGYDIAKALPQANPMPEVDIESSRYLMGDDADQPKEAWSRSATQARQITLMELNLDASESTIKCLEYEKTSYTFPTGMLL